MFQILYPDPIPLWQVLAAATLVLFSYIYLIWRCLKKPVVREAISETSSVLSDNPLFLFSEISGLQPLNDSAYKLLDQTSIDEELSLLPLLKSIKTAANSNQLVVEQNWPDKNLALVSIPLTNAQNHSASSLALVSSFNEGFRKDSKPVIAVQHTRTDRETAEVNESWIPIDSQLKIHKSQWKVCVLVDEEWTERQLNDTQNGMLRFFITNHDRKIESERIFAAGWTEEKIESFGLAPSQKEKLRAQIRLLRLAIGSEREDSPNRIMTIRGIGYSFHPDN